jgi:hypothetical protein
MLKRAPVPFNDRGIAFVPDWGRTAGGSQGPHVQTGVHEDLVEGVLIAWSKLDEHIANHCC